MRHRRGKDLDEFDFALISALRDDPRLPNNSLGKILGVTHVTVRERINRLLNNGFIRLLPVADPRAFGYDRELILTMRTQPTVSTTIAESIAGHPAVRRVQLVMGSSDVLVDAVFREESDLLAFMRMVTGTAGIIEVQTNHVITTYKNDADWAPQLQSAAGQEIDELQNFWRHSGISLDGRTFAMIQTAAHWLSALVEANVAELSRLSRTDIKVSGTVIAAGIDELIAVIVRMHHAHPEWNARIIEATEGEIDNSVMIRWVGTGHHAAGGVGHGLHVTTMLLNDGLVAVVHETRTQVLSAAQVSGV